MTSTADSAVPTRAFAALAVGALCLFGGLWAAMAPVAAQETTDPTTPELLVPGSSVPVPPTTAAPAGAAEPLATTTTTMLPVGEGGVGITITASTKVWAIIAGLVTVAFLIAALTAVYWHHTRPVPARIVAVPEEELDPPDGDPPEPDPPEPDPLDPGPADGSDPGGTDGGPESGLPGTDEPSPGPAPDEGRSIFA